MAVPPFQDFMLPFLQHISDGQEHRITELFEHLAQQFKLSEDELKELLPSGRETRFKNRVYWTRVHLGHAKLLDSTGRGRFKITPRGLELLKSKPKDRPEDPVAISGIPRVPLPLIGRRADVSGDIDCSRST